jgi:hypothetical protein
LVMLVGCWWDNNAAPSLEIVVVIARKIKVNPFFMKNTKTSKRLFLFFIVIFFVHTYSPHVLAQEEIIDTNYIYDNHLRDVLQLLDSVKKSKYKKAKIIDIPQNLSSKNWVGEQLRLGSSDRKIVEMAVNQFVKETEIEIGDEVIIVKKIHLQTNRSYPRFFWAKKKSIDVVNKILIDVFSLANYVSPKSKYKWREVAIMYDGEEPVTLKNYIFSNNELVYSCIPIHESEERVNYCVSHQTDEVKIITADESLISINEKKLNEIIKFAYKNKTATADSAGNFNPNRKKICKINLNDTNDYQNWSDCWGTAYINGEKYSGEFGLVSKVEGYGKIELKNGDIYAGGFKKEKFNGQGAFYSILSGDWYVGEFLNDTYHGQGTYYFHDGMVINGSWSNGKLAKYEGYVIKDFDPYRANYLIPRAKNINKVSKSDEVAETNRELSSGTKSSESKGFINKKNIENYFITKPEFLGFHEFSEDLAPFEKKINGRSRWGFIDAVGKIVIDPKFDWAEPFSEGLALVCLGSQDQKCGYINKENKFVVNPIFDGGERFSEGRAAVFKNGPAGRKFGFIDTAGKLVIDYIYEEPVKRHFSDGVFAAQIGKKYFFIDQSGKKTTAKEFDYLDDISEGLAGFCNNKKCGFVNKFGNAVIAPKYDRVGKFSEGMASVRIGNWTSGKWGYIDKTGKMVIAPQFAEVNEYAEGYAGVSVGGNMYNGNWGFIDKQGKFVINPQFKGWYPSFRHGYAPVCANQKSRGDFDKCGIINKNGDFVVAPEFDDGIPSVFIHNGVAIFGIKVNDEHRKVLISLTKQVKNILDLQVSTSTPDLDGIFQIKITTNSDTASLKIDGEEQGGRVDGKYSVKKIARAGGDTQITIVATDINGNTDTQTISVNRPVVVLKPSFAVLNPAQIKKQQERDAVAIIIGIADYKNFPRADYANDDARVFYDYAIRALGVKPENIKLLVDTDADDVAIYQAFKTWLPSRVRAGTDVYVYYSGHGLPTADGQGLYLLPQRAHRDFIDKTAITQAEINAAIQVAKPRSVTVFLDSCYSGQARSGETLIANARPVALKAEKKLFPDNFTVITASQADQISSSSPDLKHGIFSYYLMKGMEGDADSNKDGKITLGEMQTYLVENVGRQAGMMSRKQEPQLSGDASRVLVGK